MRLSLLFSTSAMVTPVRVDASRSSNAARKTCVTCLARSVITSGAYSMLNLRKECIRRPVSYQKSLFPDDLCVHTDDTIC